MIVAITGTAGTGKTYMAKKISKKFGWKHVEIGKLVKNKKLYSGYDRKFKSYVVNQKKFVGCIKKLVKENKNTILDGHLSHSLPKSLLNIVIVLRCKPSVLEKRLRKRKYSKEKVKQNVEAELIGLISWEARKKHKNVWEIECTKNKEMCLKAIISVIRGRGSKYKKTIDWCSKKTI